MSSINRRFSLLTVLLIVVFCLYGCEGPQGPAGEGAGDVDFMDPIVTLTLPTETDTVYTETFFVSATATDNDSISYVEFLLDGDSDLGGDSLARDYEAPYYLEWTLAGSGHGFGVYPLVAKAVDHTGNVGFSTPRIIFYFPLPPQQTIAYHGLGEETYRTLPDIYSDKFWNVRFTPLDTCQVVEVHFLFRDWEGAIQSDDGGVLTGPCDMDVYLWDSAENLPVEPAVVSRFVASENIEFDGDWTIVDFSDISSTLEFAGDFHAGFSPPEDEYTQLMNDNMGLPIVINLNPIALDDETEHRSSEKESNGLWGTMQAHYDGTPDFNIRVRVAYNNGTTELIDSSISRGATE